MSRTQSSQDEGLGTGVTGGSEFVPIAAERTPGAAEVTVIRTVSVGGQGHSLAHAGGSVIPLLKERRIGAFSRATVCQTG